MLRQAVIPDYRNTLMKTKGNTTIPTNQPLYGWLPEVHGSVLFPCYFPTPKMIQHTEIESQHAQPPYISRHTFSQNFIMNGGNTLTLLKVLGNTEITMRYASFSPEHLDDAIRFSPLEN